MPTDFSGGKRKGCARPVALVGSGTVASMRRVVCGSLLLALAAAPLAGAAKAPGTDEALRREAAIAEFTARMKAANYPALFEKAAAEFNVPADILKGVAFAETRWEQLQWPPGETVSPETGMPRPFGIMSLWDNSHFGHSLLEAAAMIGQTPEALEADAYQNIRGGAALLRKLYDAQPKPEGTTEADIESWRYAIRKYCGIPEPDFNAQHALDVYVFISRGYHQYGIEWDARPVNLEPIREETRRIVAEERAKREARLAANSNLAAPPNPVPGRTQASGLESNAPAAAGPAKGTKPPPAGVTAADPASARSGKAWWMILLALVLLAAGAVIYRMRSGSPRN